jgi:hypothetical protein
MNDNYQNYRVSFKDRKIKINKINKINFIYVSYAPCVSRDLKSYSLSYFSKSTLFQ